MQNSGPISPLSIGSIQTLDTKTSSIKGLSGGVTETGHPTESFAATLSNALGVVNQTMDDSDKANDAVVNGTAESLHTSQILGVKSDLLMKLTTTITSKLAQATTQLFQMQV